jgi:ABC-type transport system substrate-binding protein
LNIIKYICILLFILPAYTFGQIPLKTAEAYGDQLIIGEIGDPPGYLNPFEINSIIELKLNRLLFGAGLIQDEDRFGSPPSLIERRIINSSTKRGTEWLYVINRNIYFHNGTYLRNDDIKFTFEMLKKYGGHLLNRQLDFSQIQQVEIGGDLEVAFILKEKNNFFDLMLSDIPILSKEYYNTIDIRGYEQFRRFRSMGHGPFRLEAFGDKIISFIPHPNYVFGRPFLDRIIFRFYDDEQQMIDDFLQKRIDMIEVRERVTVDRIYQILKKDIKVFATPRPEKKIYFVVFNINQKPFNNFKVRQAIRYSINQNEIVQNLVQTNGHVAYSVIDYTNSVFYKELFKENYNPALSMEILQNDGWRINMPGGILEKEGAPLDMELLFEENSFLEESIARAIKIQLAELGINVLPKPVNFRQKGRLIQENRFSAVLQNYSYFDDNLYEVVKNFYFDILKNQTSVPNYSNQTIETMFKKADINPDLRKQYLQRFQIFLHRESPAVFLYFDDKIIYALDDRFENTRVRYSSDNIFYLRLMPFENWFVPKSLQKFTGR